MTDELCAQAPWADPEHDVRADLIAAVALPSPPRMKVYISGPMTGHPEHNYPAFESARKQLRCEGFEVLCPAEAGTVYGWTWEQYLTRDLAMVLDADAVVALPGWEMSRGAKLEIHVARELGIPVVDLGDSHILWELTA